MDENKFKSWMMRAKILQRLDDEKSEFYSGYQRGLRRLYHGDKFGSGQEHVRYMGLSGNRKLLGDGYRSGFSGEPPEPGTRTEHIHVRLTREEREQIEAAARKERRTLSDYLVVAGVEKAKQQEGK